MRNTDAFLRFTILFIFIEFIVLFLTAPASATSVDIDHGVEMNKPERKWQEVLDVSANLCMVLQTSLGEGAHETQPSGKFRLRIDTHIIPEQLDFVLRIQNAAGEYFLGPGQLYPVNNISIDKPSGNAIPRGNALVDYAYLCWKPSERWEFALGVFEPWTYDIDTREGVAGWLNGVDDHGRYLHNVHFFPLAGFKPSVIAQFRSLPIIAIRYDPLETLRLRGFAMTTQVEKFELFNPEWESSKHIPDYTSYFFELEYRGKLFGRESSCRLDFGWVDIIHVPGLPDPDNYGFSWGIVVSQRLFSDHFSVNAFYYFSDGTLANKWVNYVKEEEVIVFTLAWGGTASPKHRF